MTSSRGPRSAMPQRMNLNEIAQEATVSCTIGCFMPQKQSPKWDQLNQNLYFFAFWGGKYMQNIPTHSPEIRLRRKFSCLSAAVDLWSSASAMTVASFNSQFSICTSLAPLWSSATASSFLSGWHSWRRLWICVGGTRLLGFRLQQQQQNTWRQPSFWNDVLSSVSKIQRLYRTRSVHCLRIHFAHANENRHAKQMQGKRKRSRKWKEQAHLKASK